MNRVLIDRFDILYLTQQVFKQKCVFTNHSIAGAKLVISSELIINVGIHKMGFNKTTNFR